MPTGEIERFFLHYREQCIWLRCCYNTYVDLYESGDQALKVLENSAQMFFQDLNNILIDYLILQICKITDPAGEGRRKNLTCQGLDGLLIENDQMTDEIAQLSAELLRYRGLVIESRNKLISHLDRTAVFSGVTMGEHAEDEVPKFFANLQRYVDEVGNAVGVGPLDFSSSAAEGDAIDLIRVLRAKRKEVGNEEFPI